MTHQLTMFDLMREPPVIRPVDRDGPVLQGDAHETLRLPHPRLAWDMARIELHQHDDGLWMWGVCHGQGGYKVGPKWGRFALTRDDALHYAVGELTAKLDRMSPETCGLTAAQISGTRRWAEGLR